MVLHGKSLIAIMKKKQKVVFPYHWCDFSSESRGRELKEGTRGSRDGNYVKGPETY